MDGNGMKQRQHGVQDNQTRGSSESIWTDGWACPTLSRERPLRIQNGVLSSITLLPTFVFRALGDLHHHSQVSAFLAVEASRSILEGVLRTGLTLIGPCLGIRSSLSNSCELRSE